MALLYLKIYIITRIEGCMGGGGVNLKSLGKLDTLPPKMLKDLTNLETYLSPLPQLFPKFPPSNLTSGKIKSKIAQKNLMYK